MAHSVDEKLEVLIADDEESICFSLRRALERKGYVVHVASEGRAAVDIVRARVGRIRAAFLDVLMPRIGGPAVINALQSIDPEVRCCLMTAHRQKPDVSPLLASTEVPVLDKPFSLTDFIAKMEQLLVPVPCQPSVAAIIERPGGHGRKLKRVILYFPLCLGPWADILQGIFRYVRLANSWHINLQPDEDTNAVLADCPDGVIGMIKTPDAVAKIQTWGGPFIDLANELSDNPFTQVGFDYAAIGVVAAEHLLRLGTRTFAFVGLANSTFSPLVQKGFVDRIGLSGFDCCVALLKTSRARCGTSSATVGELTEWLINLPKPAAVFAVHDALALRLSEVCRMVNVNVPHEIALLGMLAIARF